MNTSLIFDNLTNPALLFFILGMVAVKLKSDLEIPANSAKFISIYLLFAIGFKGGQELAHSTIDMEIIGSMSFGIFTALVIPIYTFFIIKKKLGIENAGAIAATYGSISAVTFVTAVSFLEMQDISYGGHMVAMMALMEAPAIIVGVLLISLFSKKKNQNTLSFFSLLKHALTNGSVLLIIGSLLIGYVASDAQAEGIKPFTTDIFKGFLAVFLLDMGISSGKKLNSFFKQGWFAFFFAILMPLFNGILVAYLSQFVSGVEGNRLLLAILAASASYIAVPAAMKLAVPKANPGLYIPMALAITFPFNISIGMPIYFYVIQFCNG